MWTDVLRTSTAAGGPLHVHVAAALAERRPAAVRARARREHWWFPSRDVIAPPGTPITGRTWALAALARCAGPDVDAPRAVALGRWSGVAAYGLRTAWPTTTTVVVPHARAPRDDGRLAVVRWHDFEHVDTRVVDGLRVLDPPALLRSLAPVTDVEVLVELLIDLVQQRHTTLAEVAADLAAHPTARGRRRLEEALALLGAAGRTDSSLELRFRHRLVAAGLPLDRGQVPVPCVDGVTLSLDLGVRAARFGIDVRSMLAHSERSQLRADVRRSNQLVRIADDWRVLEATLEDLDGARFETFLAWCREVLAAQAVRHLGVPWPRPEDLAG